MYKHGLPYEIDFYKDPKQPCGYYIGNVLRIPDINNPLSIGKKRFYLRNLSKYVKNPVRPMFGFNSGFGPTKSDYFLDDKILSLSDFKPGTQYWIGQDYIGSFRMFPKNVKSSNPSVSPFPIYVSSEEDVKLFVYMGVERIKNNPNFKYIKGEDCSLVIHSTDVTVMWYRKVTIK